MGGWIILRWILEKYDSMVLTGLFLLMIGWDNEPSASIKY
jgi:hypothetical protein